jgi:putative membrane protein
VFPLAHVGGPVFEPLQVAGLTLAGTAYAFRTLTLAQEGRPVPTWRTICFASGLLLIAVAFLSPLGHLDNELVLAHMSQHLLMGDIGALLIVLGLTGPLLQPLLHNRWFGWIRHLAHPLVALPLWAIDLYVWHAPVLYQAATEHTAIHALQHTCFIGFGVLMWMPLVGPLPQPRWFGIPAKIGYVIGVRLVGTVLGNVFMWSSAVFYKDYAGGEAYWSISPLTDQGIAGVIMMAEGGMVTLGLPA